MFYLEGMVKDGSIGLLLDHTTRTVLNGSRLGKEFFFRTRESPKRVTAVASPKEKAEIREADVKYFKL
mgnify:CR=1 FL=1